MTSSGSRIRAIRADEWKQVRELRLVALQDPIAHLAFLETYEEAAAQPDSFYQDRAAGAAEGTTERQQFVAELSDGSWGGTVTVLTERAGEEDFLQKTVEVDQAHVVGVYVRPELRGTGVAERLLRAGLEWAWARGFGRVRLYVHERNERAVALYRKVGFTATGLFAEDDTGRELEMVFRRP